MGRGRPRRSLTSAGGKTSASAPRGAGRLAGAPSISPDLPFFLAVGMRIFMAYLLPVDLARQPLFEIGAAHQRLSSCPAGPTARVVVIDAQARSLHIGHERSHIVDRPPSR